MHYRIGEFAELSGVSAKTLRFYDEIGLLRPAGVNPRTRYRHYQPEQLQDLAAIRALKELGVPLPEIRQALGQSGARGDRRRLLEDLRRTVEHSIAEAQQSLCWIQAALDELSDAAPAIPVIVKRRPAARIASVRTAVASYSDILPFERDLLSAVPAESTGSLRGVLWHRCADEGSLEGEPFVELRRDVPRRSSYDVKQLPPATLACAYAGQDDEAAEQAYRALRRWLRVRGYRLAGPKREIYLDRMLEVQFPFTSV